MEPTPDAEPTTMEPPPTALERELATAIARLLRNNSHLLAAFDGDEARAKALSDALISLNAKVEQDGVGGIAWGNSSASGDVPSSCAWLQGREVSVYRPPPGPVRVYVDGCFDVMHSGHYNMLRQAKSKGDWLVVGVHSDQEILENKGPTVMNNQERLAMVQACKWVDEVVFDTPYSPSPDFIDTVSCSYCAHGDDISPGVFDDVILAGRFKVLKRTEGISTTDLVGRLLSMAKSQDVDYSGGLGHSPETASAAELLSSTAKDDHYARKAGVEFVPSCWRIASFANQRVPRPSDQVVYVVADWDLFHAGHIEALTNAKALGDFLLVGVLPDDVVHSQKGLNWPIMALHERVLNVSACKYVDDVLIGASNSVSQDMINTFNICKVAGGSPSEIQGEHDPFLVPKQLGIYVQLQKSENQLQTGDVADRIIAQHTKYAKRNASRSQKELDYYSQTKQYVADTN